MVSFKPEVRVESDPNWYGNALRFGTREEAEANVADLANRWILVTDRRVVESADAVNSAWVDGKLVVLDVAAPTGVDNSPFGRGR